MDERCAVTHYAVTRDQLVEALSRLECRVPVSGPMAGKIMAESMADALITALEQLWEEET